MQSCVNAQGATVAAANFISTQKPGNRALNATVSNSATIDPPLQSTQRPPGSSPPKPNKEDPDGPSNPRNDATEPSKPPGNDYMCGNYRGCYPWAAVYVAVGLFVILLMGMVYVIYKRRSVRRFVSNVHSPPLLEMHNGRAKKHVVEGRAPGVQTLPDVIPPRSPSTVDHTRMLHRQH
ncbi:hypothetical protein H257_06570 [Aphanomyces astaci]|uniref:Uncharacterized protein n=1 Tax=Aphanomyces astaci TaxID=112090 RepID=W4GMG5_APHAT|nr:hypothetical protein H257_06570 [Aphanomyces astaci]ETV80219.1 hypothetical protein H257_06570 [Aphanomyces astaci]|eukprot:XP_009830143.1 hypothetical protein H257_06570 [Aphanomyces astaci]